ncbi:hypothetical protein PIB30_082933 [Stylosanthes scabra]|uniref:Uncharacterized protein n=1 Tax=Stylosanthes scabra TaxID=79078 RepID=A0ABU6WTA8_9FABA|nr:hypothetical protein [Stylosanthes scabra]
MGQEINFRSLSIDPIGTLEYDAKGSEEEMKVNPEQSKMIEFCKEYIGVFAWSYHDMPGFGSRDCIAQNSSILRGRT